MQGETNSAVLVAALLAPLLGALAALLVPTGRARRPRLRRRGKAEATAQGASDAPASGLTAGEEQVPGTTAAIESDPFAAERAGNIARSLVRCSALAAAALWVALAFIGPTSAGPARAVGPVAPAAAGAALLLVGVGHPARRLAAAGAAVALALVAGGLALGVGDGGADVAVAGLAGAAGIVALANRKGAEGSFAPTALALAGAAAMAGGLVRMASVFEGLDLPTGDSVPLDAGLLLVTGSAVVAVASALRPRRAVGLLLPVALALGIPAGAVVGDAGEVFALVLMLAAAASVAAWALRSGSPRADVRPLVAALAMASLAAAVVPTSGVPGTGSAIAGVHAAGQPAAWLLAAAAVITAVTLVPVAALSAVPGAVALTVVLIADPKPSHFALVALAVATTAAGAAALRRPWPEDEHAAPSAGLLGPLLAGVPALIAGAWLVAAPQSWSWAGAVGLEGWSDTVAVALAGGLIATVAGWATGRVAVPLLPQLIGRDPVVAAADAPGSARLALAAAAALGLALIALLASSNGAG